MSSTSAPSYRASGPPSPISEVTVPPPRFTAMPWAPNTVVSPAAYNGHICRAGATWEALGVLVMDSAHAVRDRR
ncbi:hypothetical protein ACFV06_04245 [Streptomyces sp. NPDC059618]|uniref:hypothetical protein n=1 Tax=Streptomyces sp. NPDC059618 TaxID=3346887 RepID=UPI00369BD07B